MSRHKPVLLDGVLDKRLRPFLLATSIPRERKGFHHNKLFGIESEELISKSPNCLVIGPFRAGIRTITMPLKREPYWDNIMGGG